MTDAERKADDLQDINKLAARKMAARRLSSIVVFTLFAGAFIAVFMWVYTPIFLRIPRAKVIPGGRFCGRAVRFHEFDDVVP